MTTPAQIRAARSLIGISQAGLCEKAKVSTSTLKRAEGTIQPHASENARNLIRETLERLGVEFIEENGGGAGVRLRERSGDADKG